jgi:hypothetical protein
VHVSIRSGRMDVVVVVGWWSKSGTTGCWSHSVPQASIRILTPLLWFRGHHHRGRGCCGPCRFGSYDRWLVAWDWLYRVESRISTTALIITPGSVAAARSVGYPGIVLLFARR